MNLIITSEQRVGSRWMHYLFADLLRKQVSPEIDGGRFYKGDFDTVMTQVENFLANGRIPKFHGTGAVALDKFFKARGLKDFGILGVVRNPYDRTVSLAFHNRYHKKHDGFEQKKVATDKEAVVWTALSDVGFNTTHTRQYSDLMLPLYSTLSRFRPNGGFNYVWTTYEWLKEDTAGEIQYALRMLFPNQTIPRLQLIQNYVDAHDFKRKSGRDAGEEKREDLWRRKGINGDHVNWFTPECYTALEAYQNIYVGAIQREKQGEYWKKPYI